jgi:hypothetical protein
MYDEDRAARAPSLCMGRTRGGGEKGPESLSARAKLRLEGSDQRERESEERDAEKEDVHEKRRGLERIQ